MPTRPSAAGQLLPHTDGVDVPPSEHDAAAHESLHPYHAAVQNAEFVADEEEEHQIVHEDSKKLFAMFPFLRRIPIFGQACQGFGPKCTLSLGFSYLIVKGISDQILRGATYAMLVDRYKIDLMRYQRLAPIATMGWSIKALTAMVCDAIAFMGYTKRWYLTLSCVAGGACALVYGALPASPTSGNVAVALIFISCFGKANVDILSEGHYSRLIRKNPKPGPALVSWIWLYVMIGAIIASAINGPLADNHLQYYAIFLSGALQLLFGIVYVFNWYGEKRNREERAEDARVMHQAIVDEIDKRSGEAGNVIIHAGDNCGSYNNGGNDDKSALHDDINNGQFPMKDVQDGTVSKYPELHIPEPVSLCCGVVEINKEVIIRNYRVFIYSLIMSIAVITMAIGNIYASTIGVIIIITSVSVVCCGVSFWALPLLIAKVNVFGYLQMAVNVSLPVLDGFFLGDEACIPGGPHFSYTLYNTVAGIIGNVAGLVGVYCFNYIFSKRRYPFTMIVTTIINIIGGIFDFAMVQRWNIKMGIPDHAFFICGGVIVNQVCYMLNWMPMIVLLSRLCPRGSESMVYALMAGFSNLGQATAAAIGSVIMEFAWPINTDVTPCDFSNLNKLLYVAIFSSLLNIPLALLLLPNTRICDDIDINGELIEKAISKQEHHPWHEPYKEDPCAEEGKPENAVEGEAVKNDV